MKNLTIDISTGVSVEEDVTSEEIAEKESREAERVAGVQAQIDAKASAVAKLQELGLTVEEVKAAFGLEAE